MKDVTAKYSCYLPAGLYNYGMEFSTPDRYRQIKKVLIITLLLNWGIALGKIVYGYMSNIASVKADGFHSLSDGASNILALIGIAIASQPADKDHPYGHKKYETLFSLAIAAMIFFAAYNILLEGVKRLQNPVSPEVGFASFIIMILSVVINIIVIIYESRKGKDYKSDLLLSDAMHTRADLFTSMSVFIALFAVRGGLPVVDPIIAIMIAAFVGIAGYGIFKQCANVLCDTVAVTDSKKIEEVVMSIKGVRTCHKIRTRGREDDIYIDLHVEVAGHMHVDKAHDISYRIEEALKKKISGVSDVIVHIEPKGHDD